MRSTGQHSLAWLRACTKNLLVQRKLLKFGVHGRWAHHAMLLPLQLGESHDVRIPVPWNAKKWIWLEYYIREGSFDYSILLFADTHRNELESNLGDAEIRERTSVASCASLKFCNIPWLGKRSPPRGVFLCEAARAFLSRLRSSLVTGKWDTWQLMLFAYVLAGLVQTTTWSLGRRNRIQRKTGFWIMNDVLQFSVFMCRFYSGTRSRYLEHQKRSIICNGHELDFLVGFEIRYKSRQRPHAPKAHAKDWLFLLFVRCSLFVVGLVNLV